MSQKTIFLPNVWSFYRNALHLRCRTSERTSTDILQDEQDELSVLVNLEIYPGLRTSLEIREM